MTGSSKCASRHYTGEAGERYFTWQYKVSGTVGGLLNARSFARYTAGYRTEGSTVLDFGCGSGDLLKYLPCSRKIGVEINAAARLVAAQNGLEVHESLTSVAGACADIVLSNHALEHVPDPLQTLRELKSKLKPHGMLVIRLPVDDWRTQRSYDCHDINHHLYTWTPQLFGNLLMEAGFACDDIRVRVVTDAWPPHYQLLCKLLPGPAFQWCCWLTAVIRKRRQLLASCVYRGVA